MGESEAAKAHRRERAKKRYQEHREEILAKQRQYHAEHREEQNAKQRERDKGRKERHNEQQKTRYWARREELLARRRAQRKAQKEKAKATTEAGRHTKWKPVDGWEERYYAEEVAKYGPIIEDEPTQSPEELRELRRRIFAALDGRKDGQAMGVI